MVLVVVVCVFGVWLLYEVRSVRCMWCGTLNKTRV